MENLRLTDVDMTGARLSNMGALVGANLGLLSKISVSGLISGGKGDYVGGVAGQNIGTINASSSSATISSGLATYGGNAGGLAGASNGVIVGSFATGAVSAGGKDGDGIAGGLVGLVSGGSVESSYALGAVRGNTNSSVGGLIGGSFAGTISACYSTGAPTAGSGSFVGGLIGVDDSPSGSLSDTYWDTDMSGITDPSQGAGNIANDPGITGLTSAQLQSGLPAGFDPKVWAENPTINNGLPYLIANPPRK
jgi:hypothetical protein